jgi:hypothetical protein
MLTKSFGITLLLAALISGVDHIYLGIIKRGIIILIDWWNNRFKIKICLMLPSKNTKYFYNDYISKEININN